MDGCFCNDAAFLVYPPPKTGDLEILFRYEVFNMLKDGGKINVDNKARFSYQAFYCLC